MNNHDHDPMLAFLYRLAEAKTEEVQVKLKDYSPQPLGPGTIECVSNIPGAFRIITEVMVKTPSQMGGVTQKNLLMPVTFSYADVLWISERPVPMPAREQPGNPLIVSGS